MSRNHEVDVSKRRLFRSLAKPSISEPITPRAAGRPPYAVDEALFVRECDGCALCVAACDKGLISIENQLASLDVTYSACDQCGACQNVCPTLALANPAGKTGLCASVANSCENLIGYCDSCEQACPHGFLTWQASGKPVIDVQGCLGCGACAGECYTQTITLGIARR